MANRKLDEFHWHELLEHTVAKSLTPKDPIRKRLERAVEALNDAYQLIGSRTVDLFDETASPSDTGRKGRRRTRGKG